MMRRFLPSRASALFVISIALLSVQGCGLVETRADRALKASPNYKAGYNDGCASASVEGGANMRDTSLTRDAEAYAKDKAYHTGWGTGFNGCKPYRPNAGGAARPDRGPIPDPY